MKDFAVVPSLVPNVSGGISTLRESDVYYIIDGGFPEGCASGAKPPCGGR